MPTLVNGLPSTAPSRPRFSLSSSDSCGLSIAGDVSVATLRGFLGLFMSSTTTPRPSAAL